MTQNVSVIGYPKLWQVPARTEQYAYEQIIRCQSDNQFSYFAFPWATLIDSLNTWNTTQSVELLLELTKVKSNSGRKSRVVTVCQHIRCMDYLNIFKSSGVSDIFWSHKIKEHDSINGINIHPFSLFSAQTFDLLNSKKISPIITERRYLANFIGAYNPKIYLSEVRKYIYKDKGKYQDILIIDRDSWHFDRNVYQEQMKGIESSIEQRNAELNKKNEYVDAIKNSKFTLCPTGSGPSSIRIFECIELSSIPVIMTKKLELPGPLGLWNKACVFVEDNRAGYDDAIKIMRGMGDDELMSKLSHLKKLGDFVLPYAYGRIILDKIA